MADACKPGGGSPINRRITPGPPRECGDCRIDNLRTRREKTRPVNGLQHEHNNGFSQITAPAMWSLAAVVRVGKRTYRSGPQEKT